jgi:hypothetical protein
LFENKGINNTPGPTDDVSIEARRFNLATNAWETVGAPVDVAVLYDPKAIAPLRNRIAFLALRDGDPSEIDLHVYDTSDPTDLQSVDGSPLQLVGGQSDIAGLIGSMGQAVGGTVNIVRKKSADCSGGFCPWTLRRVLITSSGINEEPPGSEEIVGNVPGTGTPAWGHNVADGYDVMAFPDVGAPAEEGLVKHLSKSDHQVVGTAVPFPTAEPRLPALAFDPCDRIAFVADVLGQAIAAVPMGADGVPHGLDLTRNGSDVYFESYTRTVLAPFNGADFAMTALALGGSSIEPTLTVRFDWDPPLDLSPRVVATENTATRLCD